MKTKQLLKKLTILSVILLVTIATTKAQTTVTDSTFKPSGKLWGQVFADALYKAHSDSLNRGFGQYAGATNYPKNVNEFQFRRIYLGYTYDITAKFTADVLLSAENNNAAGDLLADNKLSPFIKYASIRMKNIFPGADLVVGQFATPAFTQSEALWAYRSVEKTVTDFHGTPSYDMGIALQGKFDPKTSNFGYTAMIGNGTSDVSPVVKSKIPSAKWLYGDIWGKFLDKKLCFDLFVDYDLINRLPSTATAATVNQTRNMIKLTAGYNTPKFTVGVEAFTNIFNDEMTAKEKSTGINDTLSPAVMGISAFVHGTIVPGKLGFFARFDAVNPNNKVDSTKYSSYTNLGGGSTGNYSNVSTGFYTEQFITAGLDFTPDKNVHIMPNIWYNSYSYQVGAAKTNNDLVLRVTFAYTFNK